MTAIRKIVCALFIIMSSSLAAIAQPTLTTLVDKDQLLIGEQLKLKVVATLPPNDFFVKWIELPDSLQHFELVERSKIDSVFTNQKLTGLSQTLTFTSFDSGKWTIPSFNVDFNPTNGDKPYELYTDSVAVTVGYQQDTTNVIRDIKDIREAKDEIPLWYWFAGIGALLLLVAAGIALYYYLKRKPKPVPLASKISPYQLAMQEMKKLQQLDLSDAAVIKQYHARLSEILKQYISSLHGSQFASSTTGEILIFMNQKGYDKTSLSRLAESLRCSDAAKFAKYLPSAEESNAGWNTVKDTIDFMQKLADKKEQSGA